MKHNIAFAGPETIPAIQLPWVTDLHLDAVERRYYERFIELIKAHNPDCLLIGGDICNGKEALHHLEQLANIFSIPLLFVLGNHDFYYGSIGKTRQMALALCDRYPNLHYLTAVGVYPLSKSTALIGHDGWADGRAGDFMNSTVMLNDYLLIEELSHLQPYDRLKVLNRLGDEAAEAVKAKLELALTQCDYVVLLTHTPPFVEACFYGDLPSDANWSPHFVCQAMGEMLRECLGRHPGKQLLVLAGHTHSAVDVQIAPNIRVLAGESALGSPSIQGMVYIN